MNNILFHSTSPTIGFVLVYFIYGLSFFSLGIALLLESQRTPSITLSRRLLPLSVFGILHGIHEWLEFFILQSEIDIAEIYPAVQWLRLAILAISFMSLMAYGVRILQPAFKLNLSDPLIGSLTLFTYAVVVLLFAGDNYGSQQWFVDADAAARIIIAIPAALLAFLALRKRSINIRLEDRTQLANFLSIASFAFLFYMITQVFVPSANILYAPRLNAEWFETTIGLPIQAVRTVVAIVIAITLIRGTQLLEEERQQELEKAQDERQIALDQLSKELSVRQRMQKEFLKSIVLAQEDERKRISRELHDETAQVLTAMGLEIATIQNKLPAEPVIVENIHRIKGLCREMSHNLKRLVHQLRPAQLDDLGLIPAIRFLIDDAKQNLSLAVDLELHGERNKIDPFLETVLFRVVQESLTNIARHAQTKQAVIWCSINKEEIVLKISDQGVGFDTSSIDRTSEYTGIVGMQERVESANGSFQIKSSHDKGTRVEVKIPYVRSEGEPWKKQYES